jgi:radical SAM-linked protein
MRDMQRLRITFSRGEELKYISHLDMMRLWERALRRAAMPVAYSESLSPQPRISLAAPLQIGMTSEGELMDVFLERRILPYYFIKGVGDQLPRGVGIKEVREVGLRLPSLQSQVRCAEYRVEVVAEKNLEEVQSAVRSLLGKDTLPWQHMRDTGPRRYDLRAFIDDLWLEDFRDSHCVLSMRLRMDSKGTGRPEQVVLALGFSSYPKSIHRTRLILAQE